MTTPTPDMATLLKVYQQHEAQRQRRHDFLQTDEGKELNRLKAAIHYERNRERILQKRAEKYEENKDLMRERNRNYARKVAAKKKARTEALLAAVLPPVENNQAAPQEDDRQRRIEEFS